MRRPPLLRAAVIAALVLSAFAASLLTIGAAQPKRSHRLVNVGGSTNHCQCTQRIDR